MKLPRRQFLHLATGAFILPVVSRTARAQMYPTGPARIIVGFPPGGPNDILARLMGRWLSEQLGQSFVVENRPGAAGNVATDYVVRAPPDGYTLLMVNVANAINATLYDKLPFDFIRDIAPVAGIVRGPDVMEVNPALPVRTVAEFISYAKSNPGKINFASAGTGTSIHMSGELFNRMAGIDMLHVPYRGSAPALTDLMAGRVQVMFDTMLSSIGYIKAGKVRALAVTTATRSLALPDIPTVGDTVPGYEVSTWNGIGAPKKTRAEIIDKLNKEINAALADPKIKARLADLGGVPMPITPAEFGRFIVEETEKWGEVVKFSGAKPD